MNTEDFAIITFPNAHLVLKSEKLLKDLDIEVIPLPSQISSGCGLCIMCDVEEIFKMTNILDNNKVIYRKLYKVSKNGLNKHIVEIEKE